ncbi:type I-F CRISPR-associated helicase Cas3f [Hafnia paralvei]|uniref:type I-F CRISPR-associated helicase Cas3f n=2 Tax=Enterobacterales TaxID=91347 RepID=UPI00266D1F54|nr:type I-F CRISPR-associated helicase Cas3f [Hafnia paralvei]
MNILLISQCSKNALVTSRRILDQFAERKGDCTWQTAITLEGLNTLRRLLRKTARRNTAVACHWIKSGGQTELLWIVGNLRRFNAQGTVPTNRTSRDILKSQDENLWHSAEAISLLAGISGLFHDFGKANQLFQQGLTATSGRRFQPYRHEWISLRLFQAFVGKQTDTEWLCSLAEVSSANEDEMLSRLERDPQPENANIFASLPPLAQAVAWLIVSHHRLPVYPQYSPNPEINYQAQPQFTDSALWLETQFNSVWNSTNQDAGDWTEQDLQRVWRFPHGTPLHSDIWCTKARKFAQRALQSRSLIAYGQLTSRFAVHISRLVLMLADHDYSSRPATSGWQSPEYSAWANTDTDTKALKQKLDEHNVGVGQNALLLGRCLPKLRQTLPAITRHKGFKQRTSHARFRWQDTAFDTAAALRERSVQQGFFGINMASTGCGKTFANARIMYALADEKQGCRFSVALGLRTLTLQTGDALRDKLQLQSDDLATLIGSSSVQQLHQLYRTMPANDVSSQSAETFFAEHQYVRYDGSLDDGRLSHWLKQDSKLHKLISAPVLVSTIDHLMPACEGIRGGKQIAPMLRLLTSDLVLDEPDDFDIADLPALCRLVNWAGMLGSRVLLSSATLPPALIQALFRAYEAGRGEYQKSCGIPNAPVNICCAWFDENNAVSEDISDGLRFKEIHESFVSQRIAKLKQVTPLRYAELIPLESPTRKISDVMASLTDVLHASMMQLHRQHHQLHESGKTVSVGLIRMANIDPLVATAQRLFSTSPETDCRIHYCVYHSQHPLAMRSHIEQRLDAMLTRHQPEALWSVAEVRHALEQYPESHHLFVVLGTSVTEVGRDWDLDWAIAEPSSMRSLIQLAGRIQRHRQRPPKTPNLHILTKNIKSLRQKDSGVATYCRPGFESQKYLLVSHDLRELLTEEQYQHIDASARIHQRADAPKRPPFNNLVDLEHYRLSLELLGKQSPAAQWWRGHVDWCGESQRQMPFRQTTKQQECALLLDDDDKLRFYNIDSGSFGWKESGEFDYPELTIADGVSAWIQASYPDVYNHLADKLGMELEEVGQKFGEICLSIYSEDSEAWRFNPVFGVFRAFE